MQTTPRDAMAGPRLSLLQDRYDLLLCVVLPCHEPSLPLLLFSGVRSISLYAPVLFDLGTESIPAVKLGDSNGVSISCIFDNSDFITLYSDACSYR